MLYFNSRIKQEIPINMSFMLYHHVTNDVWMYKMIKKNENIILQQNPDTNCRDKLTSKNLILESSKQKKFSPHSKDRFECIII